MINQIKAIDNAYIQNLDGTLIFLSEALVFVPSKELPKINLGEWELI